MQATTPVEMKSLEVLESRVQKAVDLVRKLRDDNDALRAQIAAIESSAAESAARSKELDAIRLTSQQMEREIKSLKDERHAVVSRVDALLKDLDALPLD